MAFDHWLTQAETVFKRSPVIPVLVVTNLDRIVPLARALMSGGIGIFEITLRTPIAFDAIRLLKDNLPEALVGAGTIRTVDDMDKAREAGAEFLISPGATRELLLAGVERDIPYIPGVATVSEVMEAMTHGYKAFKFFPAEAAGGVAMLKSIYGPFPDLRFCPTGGIHADNFQDYLALPNVACVGGSWVVPS